MNSYSVMDRELSGLIEICESLSSLQRCESLDDLLELAGGLLRSAGTPAWTAALVHDPFNESWQASVLIDPAGHAPRLNRQLSAAIDGGTDETATARQAIALLARTIDAGESQRLEAHAAASDPVSVLATGEQGQKALLIAVPLDGTDQALVATVMDTLAAAAERVLTLQWLRDSGGLLEQSRFEERVEQELGRARRYSREMALFVCRPADANQLRECGQLLLAKVRRWDAIGLLSSQCNELGALLPETGRGGALGLLSRLRPELAGARAGIAIFPDDGRSFDNLVALSRMRSSRIDPEPASDEGGSGNGWYRGAPAGLGPETVLCPTCLQAYSRAWRRQPDRAVSAVDIQAAQDRLASCCPAHPGYLAMTAGSAALDAPAELPENAPVLALLTRLRQASGRLRHPASPRVA